MLKVWQAGVATIAVALLSSALVVLDLSDGAFRRWWSAQAFTTDAIAGMLVVLITVSIVNQALGTPPTAGTIPRDGGARRHAVESGHPRHPGCLGLHHLW